MTADEYRVGGCAGGAEIAEIAAKSDPAFSLNADALKQVIPEDLSAA